MVCSLCLLKSMMAVRYFHLVLECINNVLTQPANVNICRSSGTLKPLVENPGFSPTLPAVPEQCLCCGSTYCPTRGTDILGVCRCHRGCLGGGCVSRWIPASRVFSAECCTVATWFMSYISAVAGFSIYAQKVWSVYGTTSKPDFI